MLGALTLPSVSTGFTSDSKAMVPVSIQGMADKVQKMSPLETMQEVFFDIRDGIETLVMQSKEALGFEKEQDREQDVDQSLGRGDKDEVEKIKQDKEKITQDK